MSLGSRNQYEVMPLVILLFSVIGVGLTEVSLAYSEIYWAVMFLIFGVIFAWVSYQKTQQISNALMHLVHWGGGVAALALVYLFIDAGRIEQSQVGLLSILLLALVTFTDSVRLGIRFSLVGVYLFIVAAIMSYIETFLWWMLLLSGIIVFFEVSLLRQKREQANRPDIEQ
jgi:hypothetical protein